MHRPALVLGFLLACGGGPPERKLAPPPNRSGTTPISANSSQPQTPTPLAPPDTPAARDLTEICNAALALPLNMPGFERIRRALTTVESTVSSDSKPLVQRLRARDLAEAAADLRQAAVAAQVMACSLADAMDAIAIAAPNPADAHALITVLEALVAVSPEYKDRILAAGCSELPACGRECSLGLAAAAEAEPSQRALALMRECAAFRAQIPAGTTASEAAAYGWIRARVAAFAETSAEQLSPADAARLTDLQNTLQL